MQSPRRLKVVRAVLNLVALRVAWTGLGAFVGLSAFGGVCQLLPEPARWLDQHGLGVGRGAELPFIALVWLACAAAGAAGFTRAWSLLLARAQRRDQSNQ